MKNLQLCKALSPIVMVLLLSLETPFTPLISQGLGAFVVPVTIRLTGKLESGSITEGTILITSGVVTIGSVSFYVSTSPVEGYNGSLNYVMIGSGKLFSTLIGLENKYIMELAAVYTSVNANTVYVSFGYGGDPYPGSTALAYRDQEWGRVAFINATGVLSVYENRVTLSAQGGAIFPRWGEESLKEGCLVSISKYPRIRGEPVDLEYWDSWRVIDWEDEDNYYVVVPKGGSTNVFISLNPTGMLAGMLSTYGALFPYERGVRIPVTVSCNTCSTSIAYLLVRSLKETLENFTSSEQEFLTKVGFDADRYLKEARYALILLEESGEAFRNGDSEVGSDLLEKSLTKIKIAIEALSQAKTDCIAIFLFLTTFTFFLSSIVSTMVEKKRALINIGLFTLLTMLELMLIPQARMAIALFNPEALSRLSTASLALSIFMAVMTLLMVGLVVLEAKGTMISDLFWYSVKNMRKRILKTVLTIVTIAVVSAVSGSLIVVGTITNTREETYVPGFRGLSISSHVTTVTYIFRGMDQGTDVIVEEFFEPMSESQVKWLSSMEWVEKTYVVAASQAFVSKGGRLFKVLLVATNASTLNGVAVSESLAEDLNAKEGDSISINGVKITISKVLKDTLMLLDGVPIDEVEEPYVVTGLELLSQPPTVYRLLLEGNVPTDFAQRIVEISYEKNATSFSSGGIQTTVQTFKSYRACLGTGSETRSLLIVGESQQFSSVPELLILIGLASLMIVITLLGSLYERRSEYSTISALGASPGQVVLLLLIEGLSYGLIGGVIGYLLSQFPQAYITTSVTPIQRYVFSPMLASFLIAIISSMIGGLILARRVILQVVPSRLLLKKIEEVKLFKDHAEAMIPIRILDDAEEFTTYVSSLIERTRPLGWGTIYMQAAPREKNVIEMTVSYRGNRVATYKIHLILPANPASTVKAVAYSATGQWSIDHKFCTKDVLTVLREDLLEYVAWKKQIEKQMAL